MSQSGDDISALNGIVQVSRETEAKLEAFVALLRKWQLAENLISPNTLGRIWWRHVADSAAVLTLFPGPARWLDIGSGAGFPGLVIALAGPVGTHVGLIESNRRKCAFLRQAVRETGAPAAVHEGRAEELLADWTSPVDRIVGRAVAPLVRLFEICEPLMEKGVPAAFHKGADFQAETDAASKAWSVDLVAHPNPTGDGVILAITGLRRKAESG